jgi:hypothetical protein
VDIIRALSVRQPHAERILTGEKTIEYRSIPTKIRERVYVYASLTYDTDAKRTAGQEPDDLYSGVIVGSVEVVGCTGKSGAYKWKLANPRRLERPIKPVHRPQPVWFRPFPDKRRATLKANRGACGHIYVLTSPNCEYVKIGGTDHQPCKRVREINAGAPYKDMGPWTLHDFRQVSGWRRVEHNLHYTFRSKLVKAIPGQKELFRVPPTQASKHLEEIDDSLIIRKPKVDRMFQDQEFVDFLVKLFRTTGILNWVDLQGAWTFNLFPSTSGGRYYTLNIGRHEVAFASNNSHGNLPVQMIHMDRLIHDYRGVTAWVKKHSGRLRNNVYASGLERSTSVTFKGDFLAGQEFLGLNGVRRAIIAYWTEALIRLQETAKTSVFARYHNMNAVAELKRRIDSQFP